MPNKYCGDCYSWVPDNMTHLCPNGHCYKDLTKPKPVSRYDKACGDFKEEDEDNPNL